MSVTFAEAYDLVLWGGSLLAFLGGLRYGQELLKL